MQFRRVALAILMLAWTVGVAGAQAPRSRTPPPPPAAPAPDGGVLRQIADAQRALGEQLQHLQGRLDELHAEVSALKDAPNELREELKAMREEVKGLYVESSTVKQAVDEVQAHVDTVDSNVSGFRTFSGFFIAAMILLLAVIFTLVIRR